MKKTITIIGWIVEAAILAGLIWKHFDLYDAENAFLLTLLSPLFVFGHWIALKKEYKENHLRQSIRLRLFFLTGPAVFLSLSLMLCRGTEMIRMTRIGIIKEIGLGLMRDGFRYQDDMQWKDLAVKRILSDGIVNTMFFASFCLLYASRYYSGKQNAIDDATIPKVSEQTKMNQSP
jgi:hypothetical protein